MSQQFPKPVRSFGRNINVKVDLSNYATKTDLKSVRHVNTSSLASLKPQVDNLDIEKLAPISIDLGKLSDVVKKDVHVKLAAKGNNIDTSDFILKTKYQTDKTELEKKNPDVTHFVKKTHFIRKQNSKQISSLATKSALTAVENKIPSITQQFNEENKIITLKSMSLKKNLLIIITTNILLFQSLILQLLFLMQDWHEEIY